MYTIKLRSRGLSYACVQRCMELRSMIKLTRINKQDTFWVNEDQIEFMEETPDTILSMVSGRKVPVAESAEEVVRLIMKVRRPIILNSGEEAYKYE
jgi:flagellar protein FlbD